MSIRLANVSKDFGNTKVLSDISVEIEPGEFFVMVGPSGSGKRSQIGDGFPKLCATAIHERCPKRPLRLGEPGFN